MVGGLGRSVVIVQLSSSILSLPQTNIDISTECVNAHCRMVYQTFVNIEVRSYI